MVTQDRLREKMVAQAQGIPVPEYRPITTLSDVRSAKDFVQDKCCILKTRCGGYDGKGQIKIKPGDSLLDAWKSLNTAPCILEEVVDFICEISVIVARNPNGVTPEMVTYGPFQNTHQDGILRVTQYPLNHPLITHEMLGKITFAADKAARQLAVALDVHGLLAVELFVNQDGKISFNEMAPRPHNSGHLTIELSDTSQFEQYVLAACGLPLGSADFNSGGQMWNIIGGRVQTEEGLMARFSGRLGLSIHRYGKIGQTDGRKIGHITVSDLPKNPNRKG